MSSYSYRRSTDPRYHGLINQGSTCYLNSVLQVLFMTKNFREALKSRDTESLDNHLNELFQELQKNTAHTCKITEKLGITRDFVQSDAAECLENILSNVASPGASQLFQGRLTQKNKCCVCKMETNTDDPFWNLPLELVDDHRDYSVLDGITKYFSESEVSGPDQLYCDSCEAKTDSTIKCEIRHHPDVLTLMLKRFKFDYNYLEYVKINRSVTIPYLLEIPPNELKSQTYELYAFVDHFGNLRNGHYTVTIKSQDDEQWYRFNDTMVTWLSYQPFQLDFTDTTSRAYLLFYKKVLAADASAENTTEVSASEAPELGAGDKSEKDQHEEEEATQKGKDVEMAAVTHNRVERQETEEERRAGVRRDQEEGPTVEKLLNKEKNTQSKLFRISDLHYGQKQEDVGKSQSKQETSTFIQEQELESSNTTHRKPEQVREETGDVENKQMKTDNEHSQRRNMDVANDGGDNSDADKPSGRLDPHSTNTFKDQTSGKMSKYFIGRDGRRYLICWTGEQSTGYGEHQKTKQNVEHESKKDVSDKLTHCLPPHSSYELNGNKSDSKKDDGNAKTRGNLDSYNAKRVAPPIEPLNDPESGQGFKQNFHGGFPYRVTGCHTTHSSFQGGVHTGTSRVKQVGGMAECAQKTGNVAHLLHSFQNLSLKDSEPQRHSNKDRNGKTENITGRQGVIGSNPGNTVSPPGQVQDVIEEPHPHDRRGGVCNFIYLSSCRKQY